MNDQEKVRWAWESGIKADACIEMGIDLLDFVPLEQKWQEETLPAIRKINFEPVVSTELERRIVFGENKRLEIIAEYERNGKPFSARRALIEVKLPVVEKYLKQYREWKIMKPDFEWRPLDVVDLKRMGKERFTRFNFERFYEKREEENKDPRRRCNSYCFIFNPGRTCPTHRLSV